MKILYIACYSLFLCLFFSCKKKDSTPTTCPFTVASVAATYKLTHVYYRTTPTGTDSEIIGSLDLCKRDDLTILNGSGSLVYQDAGVTCSPSSAYVGSWSISGNSITLETKTFTFLSFDCSNLSFYEDNRVAAGDRTTYVYTKQ